MMEMTEMFAKIRRYGAAWLCAGTVLASAWLPGTAVYASETEFHLDLDYILSYEQQQCSDMIFFGDSRVVGMSLYAGGYHYVGQTSAGYSWMSSEGASRLEQMMQEWPQADVVFCFGVNDLGNIDSYISWFDSFQANHPGRRCWYLSVNPVSERTAAANGYSVRNYMIDAFNQRLIDAFPDRYLDTYSIVMEYGAGTWDGVHYDGTTYASIEDCTWRAIMEKLDAENAAAAQNGGN